MIRYDLKCVQGHDFEAWFASSSAFVEQDESGLVTCAVCGSSEVEKALMAPRIPKKSNVNDGRKPVPQVSPALSGPVSPEMEKALSSLRREIEANSDYVGRDFASEARKMHEGLTEKRSIYGEATGEDAKKLAEDGVPVAPLPFMPKRNG